MSCLMLASLVVRAVMRWVIVGGGFGVLFRGVGVWVSNPLWGASRSWECWRARVGGAVEGGW